MHQMPRLWSAVRETTQRLCKKWFGGPRRKPEKRPTRLWLEGLEDRIVPSTNTTTLLTPSANGLLPGQAISLVAKVNPVSGAGTPTGTVTFFNGSTSLGSSSLSGGVASIAVSAGFSAGSSSLTAHYGGDANFNASTSINTSLVANDPNSVPNSIGSARNCGCPDQEGTMEKTTTNADGDSSSGASSFPVRYADGVAQIAGTDLASWGFGTRWAQTRSWTNGPGYAADGVNGVGWVDTQMPYLLQIDGTSTLADISWTWSGRKSANFRPPVSNLNFSRCPNCLSGGSTDK
jgi:hypothetical protein